jgi:alanine dehydrogenase
MPYAMELARHGWREATQTDKALAEGVNVANGVITYGPVADALGLPTTPLQSLQL